MFFRACSLQNKVGDPPIFFSISDITNSPSFNGKIFRKKSKLENFRANVLNARGNPEMKHSRSLHATETRISSGLMGHLISHYTKPTSLQIACCLFLLIGFICRYNFKFADLTLSVKQPCPLFSLSYRFCFPVCKSHISSDQKYSSTQIH